jgi:hypothetical protein
MTSFFQNKKNALLFLSLLFLSLLFLSIEKVWGENNLEGWQSVEITNYTATQTSGPNGSPISSPPLETNRTTNPLTEEILSGGPLEKNNKGVIPGGNEPILQNVSQEVTVTGEDFGCAGGVNPIRTLDACIAYMMFLGMKQTMYLAGLSAVGLNFVMMEMVVGMGQLMGNIPGIMQGWSLMRDGINIFLVFLTIFIGIATILGIERYGYKKLLWSVLLAALLVNFSSTFAKIVIDISNYTSTQAYAVLLTQSERSTTNPDFDCSATMNAAQYTDNEGQHFCIANGLAGIFWTKLKVSSIWNLSEFKVGKGVDNSWRFMILFLVGSIMFLIMAFVFASMAVLLAVRFITLAFLIIISPVALVLLITGISQYGKKWLHQLFAQSFFAPAVIIMWWLTYMITDGLGGRFEISGTIVNGATDATNGNLSGVGILIFYFLVIGMLLGSLSIAKSASAVGSHLTMNVGSTLARAGRSAARSTGQFAGRRVGGATAGTAGIAGRKILGTTGNMVKESKWANKLAANQEKGIGAFAKRKIGRTIVGAGGGLAQSSFDARALLGKNQKQWVGAPQKGGHLAARKKREDADKKAKEGLEKAEMRLTPQEQKELQTKIDAPREKVEKTLKKAEGEKEIQDLTQNAIEKRQKIKDLKHSLDTETLDENERMAKSENIAQLEKELDTTEKEMGKWFDKNEEGFEQQKEALSHLDATIQDLGVKLETEKTAFEESPKKSRERRVAEENIKKIEQDIEKTKQERENLRGKETQERREYQVKEIQRRELDKKTKLDDFNSHSPSYSPTPENEKGRLLRKEALKEVTEEAKKTRVFVEKTFNHHEEVSLNASQKERRERSASAGRNFLLQRAKRTSFLDPLGSEGLDFYEKMVKSNAQTKELTEVLQLFQEKKEMEKKGVKKEETKTSPESEKEETKTSPESEKKDK